jgi:glycosyltransferase involved in cell wall biosynthesis
MSERGEATVRSRTTMFASEPEVSVVVATRDRAERLSRLIAALHEQTLTPRRLELIVVDDGSSDGTAELLARESARTPFALIALQHEGGGGPGAARNTGWPRARGELVAFTDDDCEPDPGWLESMLAAWQREDARVLQGSTTPIEAERNEQGLFTYTYDIRELDLNFPACNMAYPRALLERLGGFDAKAFPRTGEDCDLAWRAIEAGASIEFEPRARVRHAVVHMTPGAMLRRAWRWGDAMPAFARHPELRRRRLFRRVFFNWSHWYLVRLAIALALPRRRAFWPLKWWLAHRYFEDRRWAPGAQRPSARALAWNLVVDSVETAAVVRGSLRSGTVVL